MRQYSDAIRAQAIAGHMAGESTKSLARRLEVPEATLRGWWQMAKRDQPAPKTKDWLDEQMWGLIGDSIASLRAIARQTQDAQWLGRQNAHDLAIYSGVLSDKLVRVLGALELAPEQPAQPAITRRAGEVA